MGKIRNKRKCDRRKRPTGLPSASEATAEVSGQNQNNILALLEKLGSALDEERECGCVAIASLVFEPGCTQLLIKQNLVKRLGPLLIDVNEAVQIAAAGALRNLSLSGGKDVCQVMIEDDVMTPLVVFTRQSLSKVQSANSAEVRNDGMTQHAVQAISLVWDLCECSGTAVSILDRENMLPVLLSCLNLDVYPMEITIAAAHCLHTYSEDNENLAQKPTQLASMMSTLDKVLTQEPTSNKHILLKVLASGILFNILSHVTAENRRQILGTISAVFSQTLSFNVSEFLTSAMANGDAHPQPTAENEMSMEQPAPTPIDKLKEKANDVVDILNAKQICLEILSNMCCLEDGSDDEWEDVEGVEEISDEELDMDDSDMACGDGTLSEDVLTSIVSNEIPKLVFNTCTSIVDPKLSEVLNCPEGRRCLRKFQLVQNRAMVCFNNMLSNVPTEILGGPEAFGPLWCPIFNVAFKNQVFTSMDEEFKEASASSVRSLMEKLAEHKLMQNVSVEQVLLICKLADNVEFEPAKVNLLSTIGIIGRMAARESNSAEVLKSIGQVLRTMAKSSCSLWVVAEAVDAMIDTFADGPVVDEVMASIGLLTELQQLVPVLKSRIKKERHDIGEHWPIVQAAKTNLIRFIKYKAGC